MDIERHDYCKSGKYIPYKIIGNSCIVLGNNELIIELSQYQKESFEVIYIYRDEGKKPLQMSVYKRPEHWIDVEGLEQIAAIWIPGFEYDSQIIWPFDSDYSETVENTVPNRFDINDCTLQLYSIKS